MLNRAVRPVADSDPTRQQPMCARLVASTPGLQTAGMQVRLPVHPVQGRCIVRRQPRVMEPANGLPADQAKAAGSAILKPIRVVDSSVTGKPETVAGPVIIVMGAVQHVIVLSVLVLDVMMEMVGQNAIVIKVSAMVVGVCGQETVQPPVLRDTASVPVPQVAEPFTVTAGLLPLVRTGIHAGHRILITLII